MLSLMLALMLMAQEAEAPADAPHQITSVTPLRVDIGRFRNKAKNLRVALLTEKPIVDPIVVLSGEHAVSDIVALSSGPERPIGESEALVYAPIDLVEGGGTYRWTPFPDGIFLAYDSELGRDFYSPSIDLGSCKQRAIDVFTLVTCPAGAQLLYEKNRAVLASFAEYADAATLPINRLRVDGKEAVLVRVGLKGEVVIGMLTKEADGWHLVIRPVDYAILC